MCVYVSARRAVSRPLAHCGYVVACCPPSHPSLSWSCEIHQPALPSRPTTSPLYLHFILPQVVGGVKKELSGVDEEEEEEKGPSATCCCSVVSFNDKRFDLFFLVSTRSACALPPIFSGPLDDSLRNNNNKNNKNNNQCASGVAQCGKSLTVKCSAV